MKQTELKIIHELTQERDLLKLMLKTSQKENEFLRAKLNEYELLQEEDEPFMERW